MIKEFTIACSKTVNQGNFNSLRVEFSITVAVMEGDDWHKLATQAQVDLRDKLNETYRAQRRQDVVDA